MKIVLTSEQLEQVITRIDYLENEIKNRKLEDVEKLLMFYELDKLKKCIETGVFNIN